jgi:hypothetical protein
VTPKDRLGADIVVGSYIAYGHALGRCAGLRIGKVTAIKEAHVEDSWYRRAPHGEPEWRITVQGVDDDWNTREPELCKRKGTLMFPSRMVVLAYDNLPATYQNLLRNS